MLGHKSLLGSFLTLWREGRELLNIETMLLRAEMREATAAATTAVLTSIAAIVCALIMLLMTTAAIAAWLVYAGLHVATALTIVAVVLLAITIILGLMAKAYWQSTSVVPHKTIQQVQKDLAAVSGG